MKHWWYLAVIVPLSAMVLLIWISNGETRSEAPGQQVLRVVSLTPSVTEMLFVLGLGDCIVGATDHCDYPPEAREIERVGGLGRPNIEKLLVLSPDLVITTGFERKEAIEVLRDSGIRVLDLEMRSFGEIFGALRQIGQATGKVQQAEKVIAAMQTDLRAVARRYANVPRDLRRRVFVEIWPDPITTIGGTSFIDEVIRRAGGVNVAHDLRQTYPRINPEKVVAWDPEVIIICYMGRTGHTASQLASRIGWENVSAIKETRIIDDIPNDHILRPGPRLVEGVKALAQRLYERPAQAEQQTRESGRQQELLPGTTMPTTQEIHP